MAVVEGRMSQTGAWSLGGGQTGLDSYRDGMKGCLILTFQGLQSVCFCSLRIWMTFPHLIT